MTETYVQQAATGSILVLDLHLTSQSQQQHTPQSRVWNPNEGNICSALRGIDCTSVKARALTGVDPHHLAASATSQYPSASLRGPAALRVWPPENSNKAPGSCSACCMPV